MRSGEPLVVLVIALVAACSGDPAATHGEDATASSTTTGTNATTSPPSTGADGMSSTSAAGTSTTSAATGTGATTAGGESDATSEGCLFLCTDVPAWPWDCNPWLQDCPEGEKCNAWASDGGGSWNANKCVPVDPSPDAVGEPCSAEGGGLSGIDSCDRGAMCWNVNPDTDMGTCVALCQGSPEACTPDPMSCCPPWSACTIASGGNLILCLEVCHPILQTCQSPGEACYPVGVSFQCAPDDSGDAGKPGDPCEYINVCDPGTHCGDPQTYPGCDPMALGCCIPFCELGGPECVQGTECLPWYDPMETPPLYEDLGACMIP